MTLINPRVFTETSNVPPNLLIRVKEGATDLMSTINNKQQKHTVGCYYNNYQNSYTMID